MKFLVLLAVLAGSVAQASDAPAQTKYDQAQALYLKERANIAKNEQAIQLLEQALAEVQDEDLKYDILILNSKALVWRAMQLPLDDSRKPVLESAYEKAKLAYTIDGDYADGYYAYGVALARWGEVSPLKAAFRKGELFGHLDKAAERMTKDEKLGKAMDDYGIERIKGRVEYKLGILGSRKDAMTFLSNAYKNAPNNALNAWYYADVLDKDGQDAEACRIIKDLLSKDPNTLNPERVPETVQEFKYIRENVLPEACD